MMKKRNILITAASWAVGSEILKLISELTTVVKIVTDTAKAFLRGIENKDILPWRIFELNRSASHRILYKNPLSLSFEAIGLGKPDFPENSFVKNNFHCLHYPDNTDLEDILHFQIEASENYFQSLRKVTCLLKRFFAQVFQNTIKVISQAKSELVKTFRSSDIYLKGHFFAILFSFIFFPQILLSQNHLLSINISNVKPKTGTIRIALYNNSSDWLKENKEFKIVTIVADKSEMKVDVLGLPTGEYAVTMYQDENSNGKCDKSLFGIPNERIGFSNNITPKLFKPTYKECKISIPNRTEIQINLITM